MLNTNAVLHVVLVTVTVSVSLYEYIYDVHGFYTPCSVCNTSYSFYFQFLRLELILLLILENTYRSKLKNVYKSISRIGKKLSIAPRRSPPIALSILLVSVTMLRICIDLRAGLDFSLAERITLSLSSICTFVFTIRLVAILNSIHKIYILLRDTIKISQSEENGCWASNQSDTLKLKKCLVLTSQIRRVQEVVNDTFGAEISLIQFAVLFGLAINAYLLAYLNLLEWSSFWLNMSFLLSGIECGVIASFHALSGHKTVEAAESLLEEICRFPIGPGDKNSFDQVKHFMLSNIKEPTQITALTFYPLTLESLFSTVTTAVAFVFVSLQFNSVYTKFDLYIV